MISTRIEREKITEMCQGKRNGTVPRVNLRDATGND